MDTRPFAEYRVQKYFKEDHKMIAKEKKQAIINEMEEHQTTLVHQKFR